MLPFPNSDGSVLAEPLMECVLGGLTESAKAGFATSAVLLGLTPTIFATLGSNTAESAALSIVARRPLLAFILAAGSTAVTPLRPFQYPDPAELLQARNQGAAGYTFPRWPRSQR